MTLVAAFRCTDGGILLCADREQDDGYARRPVDKIHRISGLIPCEIFIAGAGVTTVVTEAREEIEKALRAADASGINLLTEHKALIEETLKIVYSRHKEDLKKWPLGLLVVVGPRLHGVAPALYRTDRTFPVQALTYAAHGSGETIANYLADRLYVHGALPNDLLLALATFIFREAEKSTSGVGLGNDMVFIRPGGQELQFLSTDSIKEIESRIPALSEAVFSYWRNNVQLPEWIKNYAASDERAK